MRNLLIVAFISFISFTLFAGLNNKTPNGKVAEFLKKTDMLLPGNGNLFSRINGTNHKPELIKDLTANRVDSINVINLNDTILYRFTYNGAGSVLNYTSYLKRGGKYTNYHRGNYGFTQNGKMNVETSENWKDSLWVIESRQTYTFNSAGLMSSQLYESWDSTKLVNISLESYEYDGNGFITQDFYQLWETDHWLNSMRVKYELNESGKILYARQDVWMDNAWILRAIIQSTYTSWGDELVLLEELYLNPDRKFSFRRISSYNAEKQLVQALIEMNLDTVWVNQSRQIFEYEANSTIRKIYTENWEGGAWIKYNRETITYNANKQMINDLESDWIVDKWVDNSRFSFTYNQAGKILTETADGFFQDAWVADHKIVYGYDPTGELLISYGGDYWYLGVPIEWTGYVDLNIDNNSLTNLSVDGNNIKIWYKKVIIPVELTSFNAKYRNGSVVLNWQTATETNNKGFEVERKSGDFTWLEMGFVQGKGTTAKISDYVFTDNNISAGKLIYRLKQVDLDGTVQYSPEVEISATGVNSFSLSQNYPNPFNPATTITYSIPKEGHVKLRIYNPAGQLVKELVNSIKPQGTYDMNFDASALSSGIYFYSIEANSSDGSGKFNKTGKMILIK